ncbi:MAG TPA: YceI family protein [Mycobacteriales bacterium]
MTGTRPVAVNPPLVGTYRVAPAQSTIAFTTRHLFGLGVVRGSFAVQDGEIRISHPIVDSTAHARIRAASFRTGNSRRDTAVTSAQFLDPEAHPYIVFTAEQVEPVDGGWVVHGLLSVRATTRPVAVRVETASADGPELRLRAHARVDRYDLGVTAARGMAARHLDLDLDILAVRSDGQDGR